jgi:oligopeptide transport system substrate-binding protein
MRLATNASWVAMLAKVIFRPTRLVGSAPLAGGVALAALLALNGCRPRETPVQTGDQNQVLHRSIGPEVSDLDPQLATQANDYSVLSALFEGLVDEDPVDLHPVPGVAQSWDLSQEGLTYTFHLRPEARWSNGDPVTAGDFIASWHRMLLPSLGAENATQLYVIAGAEAFNRGAGKFAAVGLAAPDPHTLVVRLAHPTASFLARLNQPAWWPVHLPTLARYGAAAERGHPWALPGRLIGNGPFVLSAWQPGQEIVVTASPTFWNAAHLRLRAIHFHLIDALDAEELAFRAGQLHLTEALPPGKVDSYRREAPNRLRIDPLLGTYYLRVNVQRPGLDDVRVRRALWLAVDRAALVAKVLRGGQQPATTFTPPGLTGYTPPPGPGFDPTAARRLLAAAGHAGGAGLREFGLLYSSSEVNREIAEALQEMWRRELGVRVRLENRDVKSLLAARRIGAYDLLRSSWIADYEDPATFLDPMRSADGNNATGWSNSAYDTAVAAASRTLDPIVRTAFFAQAERLLVAEAPIIPLYHYTHVFLLAPSVRGWHPTLLDHHPYAAVSLTPESGS